MVITMHTLINMADMYSIIPVKDLMTSEDVYKEFERIINEYRDRMKNYINRTLIGASPISMINQCITIEVEKLIECATHNPTFCEDNYNYIEIAMIFTHFKTAKQIKQYNLIEYVLADITAELIKLGYQVTLEYNSSSINNKSEPPVSITLRWNHLNA
jgi:hypothetical protein